MVVSPEDWRSILSTSLLFAYGVQYCTISLLVHYRGTVCVCVCVCVWAEWGGEMPLEIDRDGLRSTLPPPPSLPPPFHLMFSLLYGVVQQ